MAESTIPRRRPWATGSAVLGAAMLAVYLILMVSEGNNTLFDVLPWAILMTIAPGLAVASVVVSGPRLARNLLIGAAALFGVLGLVSLLTIGFGFLLAAGATAVGATRV